MSREIKFEAWDSEACKMWTWEELNQSDKDGIVHLFDLLRREVPAMIPRESTGLHDKNGREIFEGDVLRQVKFYPVSSSMSWRNNWSGVAYYDVLLGGWYITKKCVYEQKHEFTLQNASLSDFEITGNIYENPELLEGK